jgi:putative uncharacterized protein (fragment)
MERFLLNVTTAILREGVTESEHAVDLVFDVAQLPLQDAEENTVTAYKVTLADKYVHLDSPFTPVTDFVCRALYRYDGLCPILNINGKPIGIEGEDRLLAQWEEIRDSLLSDYNGPFVDEQLPLLEKSMAWQQPMSNYGCLGLVFPGIQKHTHIGWQAQRKIGLSYAQDTTFTELLTCIGQDSGLRTFTVESLHQTIDNHTIEKFEGTIRIAQDDFLTSWVHVVVAYTQDSVTYSWTFKLGRTTINQEK